MRARREPNPQAQQTCFVTLATAGRRPLFGQESWALVLLNVIRRHGKEYDLHDFVIMPDQVHLLLSPHGALERTVQLIKGGFSFQARRAFDWKLDVWQPGFSSHCILDHEDYTAHVAYVRRNAASLREGKRRFDGASGHLPLTEEPERLKPRTPEESGAGAESQP